ncbi:hypothetical protein AMATHDRAFT_45105 [Amanita thiersii Skay4041]|uniref:Ras-GEF domain-containing protein n=1 Tax=Amanita thiersii Skay4041 TaxID=703135 RepID=A0A2A9NZJ9_9AGAR|nr:hypothetical protein AMATHDRAFT_45105 [Amanita thiersii Skay4041]
MVPPPCQDVRLTSLPTIFEATTRATYCSDATLLSSQQHRKLLSLEDPPILEMEDILFHAKETHTADVFLTMARIFGATAKTVLDQLHQVFVASHSDKTYRVTKSGAEFNIGLLYGQAEKSFGEPASMEMILELVDMIVANLQRLLQVAKSVTRKTKVLHQCPKLDTLGEIKTSDERDDARSDITAIFFPESVGESDEADSIDLSWVTANDDFIFNEGPPTPEVDPDTSPSDKGQSSVTLINTVHSVTSTPNGSTSSRPDVHKPLPDIPYIIRQSSFFFSPDPESPETDVEMPLPTGDTTLVWLNCAGKLKAASFPALVRMITSKHALLDLDLIPTFFSGFRIFSSPRLLLVELKSRYVGEPMPEGLKDDQQRVWTREAAYIRLRVGKIIAIWLTEYWRASDQDVLEDLRTFARDDMAELPTIIGERIMELIVDRMAGKDIRVTLAINESESVNMKSNQLTFGCKFSQDINDVLKQFNTTSRREEFAQQLTATTSMMFRNIDPWDVVEYWRIHSDSNIGPSLAETISFARSFSMFVAHSVVVSKDKKRRCQNIVFWLDVAMTCLGLRNFFVAQCIHSALTSSPVNRMKRTILCCFQELSEYAKIHFGRLDQFFSGHRNYHHVREGMSNTISAAVPFLDQVPLRRDMIALKHIPKTIEPDKKCDKELINLSYYRILMKTIRALQTCLIPYQFQANSKFTEWLETIIKNYSPDEEGKRRGEFFSMSEAAEPRDQELVGLKDPWQFVMIRKPKKIQGLSTSTS